MTRLAAPVYHYIDLQTFRRDPSLLHPSQHYVVVKCVDQRQNMSDGEIVYDAGITHFVSFDNAVAVECKLLVDRLNQESFDTYIRGRRFTRYLTRSYVSVDPQEAARLGEIDHTPTDQVRVTPDLEILCVGIPRGSSGSRGILWSDGRVTHSIGVYLPAGGSVSLKAAGLINRALERKEWRVGDAWRKLLAVADYTRENLLTFKDRYVGFESYGSDEYSLDRITTDTGLVLYEVAQEGGGMAGGDGDAWESYYVFETEHEARAQYRQLTINVLRQLLMTSADRIDHGHLPSVAAAWPALTDYAKSNFAVELPLQNEFERAQRICKLQHEQMVRHFIIEDEWDRALDAALETEETAARLDEHGYAMYLRGYAAAL